MAEFPTGFAIHQISRQSYVRNVICAPEGYVLMEQDWSQQEMRLVADASGDPTMIQACESGDPHTGMAADILSLDYDDLLQRKSTPEGKKQRDYGKFANLSLQYRVGATKAAENALKDYGIAITKEEARGIKRAYTNRYPLVEEWWTVAGEIAELKGYAETKGGRRVLLDDWNSGNNRWRNEQTAINFPIQGTAGDMKYYGLSAVKKLCIKSGTRLLFDLHDGLWFVTPEKTALEVTKEMNYILDNLDYGIFNWEPRLSFPVDASIGVYAGEMKSVN